MLDYPDYDTILGRYRMQGILSKEQAIQAIKNTLIFDECEEIKINRNIKMPNIYPELTPKERYEKLENLVYERWEIEKQT